MAGITLDTGALIALERGERRSLARWATWLEAGVTPTVPAVVLAEWCRAPKPPLARVLRAVEIDPIDESTARIAADALADLRLGPEHTIDALVMASASRRGDAVYTADLDVLSRFAAQFRTVRLIAV